MTPLASSAAVSCPLATNGVLFADTCGDGFEAVDSAGQADHTAVLQVALDASDAHTIVLRNLSMSTPWVTTPLFVYKSHRTVHLEGAFLLAKRGVACQRGFLPNVTGDDGRTCFWGRD